MGRHDPQRLQVSLIGFSEFLKNLRPFVSTLKNIWTPRFPWKINGPLVSSAWVSWKTYGLTGTWVSMSSLRYIQLLRVPWKIYKSTWVPCKFPENYIGSPGSLKTIYRSSLVLCKFPVSSWYTYMSCPSFPKNLPSVPHEKCMDSPGSLKNL